MTRILSMMAVLAACGGGSGGSGGLTPKNAIDDELDQLCSRAFECMAQYPADAPAPFDQIFGANVAACKSTLGASLSGADVQTSVDAGRITFDSGDAQACIDFQANLSCTDYWGNIFNGTPADPVACDTAFIGTVADGGVCTTDLDCSVDGSSCNNGVCGPG